MARCRVHCFGTALETRRKTFCSQAAAAKDVRSVGPRPSPRRLVFSPSSPSTTSFLRLNLRPSSRLSCLLLARPGPPFHLPRHPPPSLLHSLSVRPSRRAFRAHAVHPSSHTLSGSSSTLHPSSLRLRESLTCATCRAPASASLALALLSPGHCVLVSLSIFG